MLATFAILDLLLIALILGLSLRRLKGTTLTTAWGWAIAGLIAWTMTLLGHWGLESSPEVRNQLIYFTAVLTLCPGIAVLGAKRPGSGAWNLFILVPLVLVLGWPALTVWRWSGPRMFIMETPVLIGFLLVLLMGVGNYAGTRFGGAAVLYAGATLSLLAPVTVNGASLRAFPSEILTFATALLTLAVLLAWKRSRERCPLTLPEDRIWFDFRNAFGIVWGRRIEERLNAEAVNENWPARVTPQGLVWLSDSSPAQRTEVLRRYRHHLEWLLRRFVDPAWIEGHGRQSDASR